MKLLMSLVIILAMAIAVISGCTTKQVNDVDVIEGEVSSKPVATAPVAVPHQAQDANTPATATPAAMEEASTPEEPETPATSLNVSISLPANNIISSCSEIKQSGDYVLDRDIVFEGDSTVPDAACLKIFDTNHINLDWQGHSIT